MAYHGVLIPEAICALNVDTYNRSFMCSASTLDNGMIFQSTIKNFPSGSGADVFNIAAPVTGSLSNLWMAYNSEEWVLTDSKYKNIDPNPRNHFILQGEVFSGYKPCVGDIILLSGESMTGTVESTYAIATTAKYQLTWANALIAKDTLSYVYRGTKYVSIATGSSVGGTQRTTAYELECIVAGKDMG